jgi:2-methylcitrate dehydratase PrpD
VTAKATVAVVPEFDDGYPDRWGSRVTVRTSNGETLAAERPVCKGDPEQPVTPREMRTKAAMLLQHGGWTTQQASALIESILALPGDAALPDVAQIVS